MKDLKLFVVLLFLILATSVTPQQKKVQPKRQQTQKAITVLVQEPLTDIDGNVYKTVKIGKQIWMVENLKVTHYRDGDVISNVKDSTSWKSSYSAYCDYNNDAGNAVKYGKLYNWFAVDDSRSIAPKGWHVATDDEWTVLTDYLGGDDDAGGKLKEIGLSNWKSPNEGANNETGFSALPGGCRFDNGLFNGLSDTGSWWSSSEAGGEKAGFRLMLSSARWVFRYKFNKQFGLSIRCVKDSE